MWRMCSGRKGGAGCGCTRRAAKCIRCRRITIYRIIWKSTWLQQGLPMMQRGRCFELPAGGATRLLRSHVGTLCSGGRRTQEFDPFLITSDATFTPTFGLDRATTGELSNPNTLASRAFSFSLGTASTVQGSEFFVSMSGSAQGTKFQSIDNLLVESVPDPGTSFLVLAGLALIASGARRARRQHRNSCCVRTLAGCSIASALGRDFSRQTTQRRGEIAKGEQHALGAHNRAYVNSPVAPGRAPKRAASRKRYFQELTKDL
jgi:hypothetical protein